jgi:hypothetical protein
MYSTMHPYPFLLYTDFCSSIPWMSISSSCRTNAIARVLKASQLRDQTLQATVVRESVKVAQAGSRIEKSRRSNVRSRIKNCRTASLAIAVTRSISWSGIVSDTTAAPVYMILSERRLPALTFVERTMATSRNMLRAPRYFAGAKYLAWRLTESFWSKSPAQCPSLQNPKLHQHKACATFQNLH